MKPSNFRYVVPEDLESAIIARSGPEDSVVLAGGQSLVPTMNFRLSNPDVVIDLRKVAELDFIRVEDGNIHIGAMTRQRKLEKSAEAFEANPLIRETLENVAHPVIRNRGTVGGSLAHADPSAELPTLFTLMRGTLVAQGPNGRRSILAEDFFEFIFSTSLEPDELLVEAIVPQLEKGEGYAFLEFARRHGDYAVAGVGATLRLSKDGSISQARLGACGISTKPALLEASEQILVGEVPSKELFERAGDAAKQYVSSSDDPGMPPGYRPHVLSGLVARVLSNALVRAESGR